MSKLSAKEVELAKVAGWNGHELRSSTPAFGGRVRIAAGEPA
jgi:hypothetical protein